MQFIDEFKAGRAWGLLTSIDLFDCNPKKIRSAKEIKRYVRELCKLIDMKRYGPTIAIRFGSEERVKGYSMMQLIETSLISGHFAEQTNSAYIDIFSCKYYDPIIAEKFTKKFFEAKRVESYFTIRRMPWARKQKLAEIPNPRDWFFETLELNRGVALAVKGKRIYYKKSPYQTIEVYKTKAFGKMLVLDGVIQLTESDEFAYHEMIVHPALHVHPKPERVLVIGGGDGGAIREIAKHRDVKEIHLCDIDEEVVNAAKKYLPFTAVGFKDKRVKIFHEDGFVFLDGRKNFYDVIIVDSTDPIGPGKTLFGSRFYRLVYDSLKGDGIMINQLESIFYHKEFIGKTVRKIKRIFPKLWYYYTIVPTYPSGMIGFGFASKKYSPLKIRNKKLKGKLKYYSKEIHKAAFALPKFAEKIL
ncbi:MAG: polyamine aminopropyltransferase [Candidatus Diapherotrites archaeon]|nr:polyamine aminopropyltransferase [Candidatus Diapherotrites archaeon]